MKQFKGERTEKDMNKLAKSKGWKVYKLDHQTRMAKSFGDNENKLNIDVCIRSFGRFFVYDGNGNCLGSEMSVNLDGINWYDEILEIMYIYQNSTI